MTRKACNHCTFCYLLTISIAKSIHCLQTLQWINAILQRMEYKSKGIDATLQEWKSLLSAMKSLFSHVISRCLYVHSGLFIWTKFMAFLYSMSYKQLLHFHAMFIAKVNTWSLLQLTHLCNARIHKWFEPTFSILHLDKVTIYVELHHFICPMSTTFYKICTSKSKRIINFMQYFH